MSGRRLSASRQDFRVVIFECGGTRKLIALLTDGVFVRKTLAHLGHTSEPPPLAPARAPPEPEFAW